MKTNVGVVFGGRSVENEISVITANQAMAAMDTEKYEITPIYITKEGKWYKVSYNLQEGYMHSDYVSVLTRENAELGYGRINGSSVNVRSGPGTSYAIAEYEKLIGGEQGEQYGHQQQETEDAFRKT